MSNYLDYGTREAGPVTDSAVLVGFFNTVYAWMATGLAVTALVGWLVSQNQALLNLIYAGPGVVMVLVLGAFGLAMLVQTAAHRISAGAGIALFMLYAALIGAIISYVFVVYQVETLAAAFVLTAGTFGLMSAYGFITKRDLSGIGSVLVMCFIGLFIGSLVNLWIASEAFSWFITYGVLAVFIGITAYHTQRLKLMAYETADNPELAGRYAIIGSLLLYVAFINLFLSILRILGSRR